PRPSRCDAGVARRAASPRVPFVALFLMVGLAAGWSRGVAEPSAKSQATAGAVSPSRAMTGRAPLDVARVLAARYPAEPVMSYIPALAWSGSLRLAVLTGEDRWREKP